MITENDNILLESGTNEVEFIEFYLGGRSYGVNVAKVTRVVRASELDVTPLDNAHEAILGLIYQREEPITFLDTAKALDIHSPNVAPEDDKRIAIITNFNGTTSSYLVDGVHKIHRCSWSKLQAIDNSTHGCHNSYCTGIVRIDGKPILILDLERLFGDYFNTSEKETVIDSPSEVDPRRSKFKILLCEDSSVIRKKTINQLTEYGYNNVEEFINGAECLEFLKSCIHEIDTEGLSYDHFFNAILTDIEMPQMDGLSLCREIKNSLFPHAEVPVIIYSSLINDNMKKRCEQVGADDCISKPDSRKIGLSIDKFL